MNKAVLLLTAIASLTMANVRAEDSPFVPETPDLVDAKLDEVEIAAGEEAVGWHREHPGKHNTNYLKSVGRAHALKRGIRERGLLFIFSKDFDQSVRALETPAPQESVAEILNDGRDLTLNTPGGVTLKEVHDLLQKIGAEENVYFSDSKKADGDLVYLSTPNAQNKDILVVVRVEAASIHVVPVNRTREVVLKETQDFLWNAHLPYNERE